MEQTNTSVLTVEQLAALLRETEHAHGEYEAQLGHRDEDWPTWYAAYMLPRLQALRAAQGSGGCGHPA